MIGHMYKDKKKTDFQSLNTRNTLLLPFSVSPVTTILSIMAVQIESITCML